jgi:hypothetical protein
MPVLAAGFGAPVDEASCVGGAKALSARITAEPHSAPRALSIDA